MRKGKGEVEGKGRGRVHEKMRRVDKKGEVWLA